VSIVDNVRVEVAFATAPDDPAPAFVDVSSWVVGNAGIQIVRGRRDEYATVGPGTCALTFDNTDGRFTAGYAGSPWYPNVKIRKKLRVTYRDPTVAGNMLTVEDATFEAGTLGTWTAGGSVPPTLTNSTTQPASGTKSLLITWGAAGTLPLAGPAALSGLVIGRTYTVSAKVYVPAGSPDVKLVVAGGATGTSTAVKAAQTRISLTFTATAASHTAQVWPATAPTAGQQCWVDEAQVDEGPLGTFATTAMPIFYRFTGYVDEWPTSWPAGKDYSEAQVTAVDRFKQLGTGNPLRSVIEQEYLADNPYAYYTLGEPTASILAGDTSKNGRGSLAIAQVGTGGTLTFGSGTGPPTDALPAVQLAPVNSTNGKLLAVTLPASSPTSTGQGLEVYFNTSVVAYQDIATLTTSAGFVLELDIDSNGKLVAFTPNGSSVSTAGSVADGATHHAAMTVAYAGGNQTLTLVLDGTTVGTAVTAGSVKPFTQMTVGGAKNIVFYSAFSGTISHAACYDTAPTVARFAAHRTAGVTGFSGERSDQRIARYAGYAGIPTADQVLDTGLSTSICAVDISGQAPLQAMQNIAATESGILAVNGAGLLAFQSRGHRYNTASVLTLTTGDLDPSTRFVANDAYLVNDVTADRPGGITFRAVNAQSVTDYGTARATPTLLTTSDNEVVDAANWQSNQTADPASRPPALTVDILNKPATVAAVLALDVSSRVTAGALPVQAPFTTGDLFIEGWTENIGSASWTFAFNTSPASQSGVWQLDSSVHSQLGTSTRLAY